MRPIAAAVLAVSGCSFIAVTPVADNDRAGTHCTRTVADPVLDTIMATVGMSVGVGGAIAVRGGQEGCILCSENASRLYLGMGLLVAVPFAISARYGYVATHECRERRATSGLEVVHARLVVTKVSQGGEPIFVVDRGLRAGVHPQCAAELHDLYVSERTGVPSDASPTPVVIRAVRDDETDIHASPPLICKDPPKDCRDWVLICAGPAP